MHTIKVDLHSNSYDIIIDESLSLFYTYIKTLSCKKIMIVSDSKVAKLYLAKIKNKIESELTKKVYFFTFKQGEKSKTLEIVQKAYITALKSGLDRTSCLVALGGGVTGDIGGFIASTFMRGIKFIQLPTSLLAMVDSSVGGKTGVDFLGHKNIIGTFYQPKAVFISTKFLKTLPDRELKNALAEVIKYGIIDGEDFFSFLENNHAKIIKKDKSTLTSIIKKCCEIKANIVSKDEKEKNVREILNLGHTFGHSIEKTSNFKYSHGEAVSIGIKMASDLSFNLGKINKETVSRIKNILESFSLSTKANKLSCKSIYNEMKKDKKIKNDMINFTLINGIGDVVTGQEASKKEIKSVIKANLH